MFCCWFESWCKAMVNQGLGLGSLFLPSAKTHEGVRERGPFPIPVSGAPEGQNRSGFNLHVRLQYPKKSPTSDDVLFMYMDNLRSYRPSTAFHQQFKVRAPNRTERWRGHELSVSCPRTWAGQEKKTLQQQRQWSSRWAKVVCTYLPAFEAPSL